MVEGRTQLESPVLPVLRWRPRMLTRLLHKLRQGAVLHMLRQGPRVVTRLPFQHV